MNDTLPSLKKLCLIMLVNSQDRMQSVELFGDSESDIKKSFRFQFLTQNGFHISGVYPVKGRADLVNV